MLVFTSIALIAGIVLLALGYRKNNRNLLLVGALVLYVSAVTPSVINGFVEGYNAARSDSGQT